MKINVASVNPDYDFEVTGVSYVGAPISGTVMFVSKKVESLLANLVGKEHCLIFAEKGINCNPDLKKNNCFVFVDNPQLAYAEFVTKLENEKLAEEKLKKYSLTEQGYYLGENVQIGDNAYIEPGCLIGHDVIIGDNARILAGAVIKNAVIGNDFFCGEKAVVGSTGFTMAEDSNGNKVRIPTLGKVIIGDYVEVGTHNNVSCGSAGNTVLKDYVKLDTLIHIGHDAYLDENTEITASCVVGGFARLDKHAYMGINSCIRNRKNIGENGFVGMGAVVVKSVPDDTVVVGNPAKKFN